MHCDMHQHRGSGRVVILVLGTHVRQITGPLPRHTPTSLDTKATQLAQAARCPAHPARCRRAAGSEEAGQVTRAVKNCCRGLQLSFNVHERNRCCYFWMTMQEEASWGRSAWCLGHMCVRQPPKAAGFWHARSYACRTIAMTNAHDAHAPERKV